jgi:hypothetical protein
VMTTLGPWLADRVVLSRRRLALPYCRPARGWPARGHDPAAPR